MPTAATNSVLSVWSQNSKLRAGCHNLEHYQECEKNPDLDPTIRSRTSED